VDINVNIYVTRSDIQIAWRWEKPSSKILGRGTEGMRRTQTSGDNMSTRKLRTDFKVDE